MSCSCSKCFGPFRCQFSTIKKLLLLLACALSFIPVYFYLYSEINQQHSEQKAYANITTTSYIINTATCKIPDLDPWHESVRALDEQCNVGDAAVEPMCREKAGRDWLFAKDSKLVVNHSAIIAQGYSWNSLRCCYRVLERVEQSLDEHDGKADLRVRLSNKCHRFSKEINHVPHDFIKVFCISDSFPLFQDVVYREYFALPRLDAHAQEKVQRWKNVPPSKLPPNVILLGIDTNSRLNSHRQFYQTRRILRKLGAVEFFGYTKVGENTFPNTVPMLVGIAEDELRPYYCLESNDGAQDYCPYIWKDFDRAGYLTAEVDDVPFIGTFHHMKAGFVHKPTDFYYRPFTLGVMNRRSALYVKCIGHRRNDEVQLDYIRDVLRVASGKAPVFLHSWSTTYTHDCIHNAGWLDPPTADFLQESIVSINNTVFFFLSDHGNRHGSFRETTLGWYEDKLPSMWMYLTPDLKEKFPEWSSAININARKLTSHYDLYHTMIQILGTFNKNLSFNESYEALNKPVPMKRGQTLFKPVPENRTCEDAGIPRGFCPCTIPQILDVKSEDPTVKHIVDKIVRAVLTYLRKILPSVCATPVLKEVVEGKHINKVSGRRTHSSETYILSFYTDPGNFLFEATVKASHPFFGRRGVYKVDRLSDILRMNRMTKSADCVNSPELQRYCYCT